MPHGSSLCFPSPYLEIFPRRFLCKHDTGQWAKFDCILNSIRHKKTRCLHRLCNFFPFFPLNLFETERAVVNHD